jgi:hypothetical protein
LNTKSPGKISGQKRSLLDRIPWRFLNNPCAEFSKTSGILPGGWQTGSFA